MSQRTMAALLALPLLLVLLVLVAVSPLPYVTYSPGPTVDILSTRDGEETVQITGRRAYHDDGELRLTTIYVDQPQDRVTLDRLVAAWLDPTEAVYPRSAVYAPDETDETNDAESAGQMVSSQDAAIATALTELGYDVEPAVEVLNVQEDYPADGRLQVRDVLVEIGGREIGSPQDVVDAVDAAQLDQPLDFTVLRRERRVSLEVTPKDFDGDKRVGITPGLGYTFPFDVTVDIGEGIGGPSAGLMFSLAIYDTLTPGSLTGGEVVAGSGTIDSDGRTGPIGGVQQKIAGAQEAGAGLFLVAPDNCPDTTGLDTGDMRLVRADTMHDAVEAIQSWVDDPDTPLPSCEEQS